jgi:ABC-type antimicrobial peptide transport system permease subunit
MARNVRDEIRQIDQSASLDNVATLDAIVANALTRPRLYAVLPALLALLALTLAAVGVYGVTAYGVARRTREIGIRLALGARPAAVVGMVMKQSATLTIAGTLLGLAGAAATTRYLQSLLFGLTPLDAETFAGVAVLLTTIAAVASYMPAGRATRISAMEALRHD